VAASVDEAATFFMRNVHHLKQKMSSKDDCFGGKPGYATGIPGMTFRKIHLTFYTSLSILHQPKFIPMHKDSRKTSRHQIV
jgi:hypothetical protein